MKITINLYPVNHRVPSLEVIHLESDTARALSLMAFLVDGRAIAPYMVAVDAGDMAEIQHHVHDNRDVFWFESESRCMFHPMRKLIGEIMPDSMRDIRAICEGMSFKDAKAEFLAMSNQVPHDSIYKVHIAPGGIR